MKCIYTHGQHTKDTTETNIKIKNAIILIEIRKEDMLLTVHK